MSEHLLRDLKMYYNNNATSTFESHVIFSCTFLCYIIHHI